MCRYMHSRVCTHVVCIQKRRFLAGCCTLLESGAVGVEAVGNLSPEQALGVILIHSQAAEPGDLTVNHATDLQVGWGYLCIRIKGKKQPLFPVTHTIMLASAI